MVAEALNEQLKSIVQKLVKNLYTSYVPTSLNVILEHDNEK